MRPAEATDPDWANDDAIRARTIILAALTSIVTEANVAMSWANQLPDVTGRRSLRAGLIAVRFAAECARTIVEEMR